MEKAQTTAWSMAAAIGVLADLPMRCIVAYIMLGVGQMVKIYANSIYERGKMEVCDVVTGFLVPSAGQRMVKK